MPPGQGYGGGMKPGTIKPEDYAMVNDTMAYLPSDDQVKQDKLSGVLNSLSIFFGTIGGSPEVVRPATFSAKPFFASQRSPSSAGSQVRRPRSCSCRARL